MTPSGTSPPADDATPAPGPEAGRGRPILVATWAGTALFTVAAVAATVAPDRLAGAAAAIDGVLFAIGCAAFVLSFAKAVARSQREEIAVTTLYFLAGDTPSRVRWALLGALAVQVVVAVATASIRPFTPLAFGILVPVFGLGLCGLWAAMHGRFPPRRPR